MVPRPIDIVALEWDDENEEHIEEHIHPWLIEEMVEHQQFYVFSNHRDHPPERCKLIGPTPSGIFVTAVLAPTLEFGLWRPITAWHTTEYERDMYRRLAGSS